MILHPPSVTGRIVMRTVPLGGGLAETIFDRLDGGPLFMIDRWFFSKTKVVLGSPRRGRRVRAAGHPFRVVRGWRVADLAVVVCEDGWRAWYFSVWWLLVEAEEWLFVRAARLLDRLNLLGGRRILLGCWGDLLPGWRGVPDALKRAEELGMKDGIAQGQEMLKDTVSRAVYSFEETHGLMHYRELEDH